MGNNLRWHEKMTNIDFIEFYHRIFGSFLCEILTLPTILIGLSRVGHSNRNSVWTLESQCIKGESSPRRKWPNVNCSHSKHGNICFEKYQVSVETQKRFEILKMSLLRTGLRKVLRPFLAIFGYFYGFYERMRILNFEKIFCQPKSRFDF